MMRRSVAFAQWSIVMACLHCGGEGKRIVHDDRSILGFLGNGGGAGIDANGISARLDRLRYGKRRRLLFAISIQHRSTSSTAGYSLPSAGGEAEPSFGLMMLGRRSHPSASKRPLPARTGSIEFAITSSTAYPTARRDPQSPLGYTLIATSFIRLDSRRCTRLT